MEFGVVVGVVFKENVVCEKLEVGDVVILFGGKIGCDGVGGVIGLFKV